MSEAERVDEAPVPAGATPAVRFFYERAGFIVGYRLSGAISLAVAESWLQRKVAVGEARIRWEEEECAWDGDEPLEEGTAHEMCIVEIDVYPCSNCGHAEKHTEHLGSIAHVPGDGYARVVEAELALQAMRALEGDE